jgi:hypothetical protein
MHTDEASMVLMGHHLEPAQVKALEQKLASQPDDYEDRLRLIGYYFKHYQCCETAGKRRIDHIVWLIRKNPSFNPILGSYVNTHPLDRRAYACIKAAWQAALNRNERDMNVRTNMAGFVHLIEPELALELWEAALVMSPANAAVISRLQRMRDTMEMLIANRDSFTSNSHSYFVPGAVPCPGTGKVALPQRDGTKRSTL